MRYWGYLIATMYALILMILLLPLASLLIGIDELSYFNWYGLAFFILLGLAQVIMLAVPVAVLEKRPIARRSVRGTVIMSAICFGALSVAALFSVAAGVGGDGGLHESLLYLSAAIALGWIVWGTLFSFQIQPEKSESVIQRLTARLIQGSILELLIAVPCHIAVRQRNDCCAGIATALGISTGIAVMLFAFGPGALFLYIQRMRRLRPGKETQE